MCREKQNTETNNNAAYKYCLNCGSELKGMYCHNCGQQASNPNLHTKGFVMEYLNNAFMWDSQFTSTLWTLLRRPGHLTNNFLAGKFISQVHPLKLNMFLLFIFITLFLLFSNKEKINNSVSDITNNELVYPGVYMELILKDAEYIEKINKSHRDTVLLYAPFHIAIKYPEVINSTEAIDDSKIESIDKWTAIIPHVFIQDKIIIRKESEDCYHFNKDIKINTIGMDILHQIWLQIIEIITRYFPMIVLLTAPCLTLSLRLIQYKDKRPHIHNLIFSLHYIAFLEVLFILIFILHLIDVNRIIPLQFISIIVSCAYLSVAIKNVYGIDSWFKAIAKAFFISFVYLLICLSILLMIFFIACIIVSAEF